MLRLKDSRDPISGISALDYIMMVSKNQMILDSYKGNLIEGESYKALTEEAQAQMLEKLEERSDSIASTIMTEHSNNSVTPPRNSSMRFGSVYSV